MIDPKGAPKFSDPFDRAALFSFQMKSLDEKLDAIDKKLDKIGETINKHDQRMTALERDRFLYITIGIISVVFSMLALGTVIYK